MFNNKKIKEQQELIDGLRKERHKYQDKYYDSERENARLITRVENLEEQNKDLIEWIKQIIKEVGCYEVKDRNQFRIPIYKEESSRMIDGFGKQTRKDITIPTIHITEFSKLDDWYV